MAGFKIGDLFFSGRSSCQVFSPVFKSGWRLLLPNATKGLSFPLDLTVGGGSEPRFESGRGGIYTRFSVQGGVLLGFTKGGFKGIVLHRGLKHCFSRTSSRSRRGAHPRLLLRMGSATSERNRMILFYTIFRGNHDELTPL